MTQVTIQQILASSSCPHPREVQSFSRRINYIRGLLQSPAEIPPYRTYMRECTVREFERYGRTSPQVDPTRTVAEEDPLLAGRPASSGFAPQRFRLRHIRGVTNAATDAPSRNEDDLAK
jgi:hypothetical protein